MITEKLRELVAEKIRTDFMDSAAVGQGGNNTNPVSGTLDASLGINITPQTSASTGSVIEAKLSIGGSALNSNIIREVGIFDNATPTANMIQRINFDAVGPISTTDTLEIIILMEVE